MRGVDWPAMRERYAALLPRVGTRQELNDLIGQMIGELGTSHTYIWGGQTHDEVQPVPVGSLGADVEPAPGGLRIARILPGGAWDDDLVSPLGMPHLEVEPGQVIQTVDGRLVTAGSNIHDLLQNRAGRMVRLAVSDDSDGIHRRAVQVRALSGDRELRYAAWVESNRAAVEEASGGRIGYVHIPGMAGDGLAAFSRQFFPQHDRPALIVDVRSNGGGFVSQMILQRLARSPIGFAAPRHGAVIRYPRRAVHAHLVVLIDQHAGSDGDIFPAAVRLKGLGTLIGTRTWGGVIGIRGDKPFVDLGLSTQPEFAWWDEQSGWSIENRGVEPDIEVEITPADRLADRDPQLERAFQFLMEELQREPKALPELPVP
jgi:tricorn protease